MRHGVFSVRDTKADAFYPPFISQNAGTACRALSDHVNNPGHLFAVHSVDFTLYQIGDFDDVSGGMSPCDPVEIARLNTLVRKD